MRAKEFVTEAHHYRMATQKMGNWKVHLDSHAVVTMADRDIDSGSVINILGFACRNVINHNFSTVIGSNISTQSACTVHINNLLIKNTPPQDQTATDYLVRDTISGMVKYKTIPGPAVFGLYAQTGNSITVSGTTSELSIIGPGVGTLNVPTNGFSVGDSFVVRVSGDLGANNGDDLTLRVKSGSAEFGVVGPLNMPNVTSSHFSFEVTFTIRAVGTAGNAKIQSSGFFTFTQNAGGTFEGDNFSTLNQNPWSRIGENGDPILILRNGQAPSETEAWIPTIEEINKDLGSIYFGSTQQLPLEVASSNYDSYQSNPPTIPNQYSGSQIIVTSGRLVFNSSLDHILLSSNMSINLNAIESINVDTDTMIIQTGKLYLGDKEADEPLLLGNQTVDLLEELIDSLQSFMNTCQTLVGVPAGVLMAPLNQKALTVNTTLTALKTRINNQELTSKDNFTI